MKPVVEIYTDGACSRNPGPGGWAAILIEGDRRKELSGGDKNTTNQRMEMTAPIAALKALKTSCQVTIYSDSAYVVNCFKQKWYTGWRRNGWKNSKGEPVANQELWQQLLELVEKHDVTFSKVKGHAGVELNERCDVLAKQAVPRD